MSTITDTNYFNDPSSYRAFLAKIYAGLAVSGQQGPAGNGDIQGIDEGFSQYLRLYWEAQELPTDEAVIAWGDVGLPEMNTQLWASNNTFVVSMYYRVAFQVSLANEFLRQTTDAKLAERNVSTESQGADPDLPRRGPVPSGAQLLARHRSVRQHPAGDRGRSAGRRRHRSRAPARRSIDFLVSELNAMQADLPGYG